MLHSINPNYAFVHGEYVGDAEHRGGKIEDLLWLNLAGGRADENLDQKCLGGSQCIPTKSE